MKEESKQHSGIAIVGLAGRFPKAQSVAEFWKNLCGGVEGISFFDEEEFPAAGNGRNGNLVKARGLLDGADFFDAQFFGIKPTEAQVMDPQHRVLLECAWSALEDAGYDPAKFDGSIGVFAGMSMNTYFANNLLSNPELIARVGDYQTMLGNDKDFLPTRVSYKLGLTGPSLNIQTACSTSLVAVCVACQHLLNFQCDMALAGAVSIRFPQKQGYHFQEGSIASPDGHCRVFDAKAAGTVPGEGVGIVVLKRCEDAIADGDTIYAVIKGFATNNDGANKVGYTAPSVAGQAEVIAQAQAMAGASPESISYIEAHGTGTPLGDPIEIEALTQAFRDATDRRGFCAIGSVKSNIGHLDAAAGVAGLIKTALALHHKTIPPSLHFHTPNPRIDFANSPFVVNAALKEWPGPLRRAGISSFGIGGTNAHLVLEEAPATQKSGDVRQDQILLLSAKTEAALDRATVNLAEYLKQQPEASLPDIGQGPDLVVGHGKECFPNDSLPRRLQIGTLPDVAYTLQVGRRAFLHRRMLVCRTANDAVEALATRDSACVFSNRASDAASPVVFMFPGQGAQHVNMGLELYQSERLFREQIDEACRLLTPHLGLDLRTLLYPEPRCAEAAARQLAQTAITQPALFVIEYALARLWMSWGVQPATMIGHSIGEYVAACLAGVFSLPDALKLVAERARLMQSQPAGSMLAVRMAEADLRDLLNGAFSIAAINAPGLCVASGPTESIESLRQTLTERGVAATQLQTSHAFHSALMEEVRAPFLQLVSKVNRNEPQIPFISNVTGKLITPGEATDPAYWARHLRETVRFADGVGNLLKSPDHVFLEVGPGHTLSQFTKQNPAREPKTMVVSSLGRSKDPLPADTSILTALGQLWLGGVEIDWPAFHVGNPRKRIPLPTYPFERTRYWVEPGSPHPQAVPSNGNGTLHDEAPAAPLAGNVEKSETSESGTRKDKILRRLRAMLADLSGMNFNGVESRTTFMEMGFESLFLTQTSVAIEKTFGVRIAFRQLIESANSLWNLADYLESRLPQDEALWETPRRAQVSSVEEVHAEDSSVSTVQLSDSRRPGADVEGDAGSRIDFGFEFGVPSAGKEIPVTDSQRELWFAAQISEAASCAFNECRLLQLRGKLDRAVIIDAVQMLVARHDSLRTTFAVSGDVQRVRPESELDIPIVELRAEDCVVRLDEVKRAEASRAFDLIQGPLFRAQLLAFSPEHHVLVLTAHHLVCDGQSFGILLRELAEIYSAKVCGQSITLPKPLQFSEYVEGLTSRQDGDGEAESYWLKQFAEIPPVLDLPTDLPRPRTWQFDGACQSCEFSAELVRQVKLMSAQNDCTLFTTLFAGWAVLLGRLTGQSDLVIGVPVAERSQERSNSTVGHCINFLPVRVSVDGQAGFTKHLANAQRLFLGAHEHRHMTFGTLIQKLNVPRHPDRMPLVSVTLNVERPAAELNFEGLKVELDTNPYAFTSFDINLNITESDGMLRLECRYNQALFHAETIQRWLGHFQTLLESAIKYPEQRADEIAILTERERHQLLVEWNNTRLDYAKDTCVHQMFEAQVQKTPNAVAAIFNEDRLTYREINRRANQVANYLNNFGVGPEVCVGICVERSLEMMVGLLGILKAGGVYVPLDPNYPKERLRFMLEDAKAPILLTQKHLLKDWNFDRQGLKTVCIESIPATQTDTQCDSRVKSENAAYVIYTSGSTNKPKGVVVTHRNVANLFAAMDRVMGAGRGLWLGLTSVCFDISVVELFWTIARGSTLVIQADESRARGERGPQLSIADNIVRNGVTHVQCTPSLATDLLMSNDALKVLSNLEKLVLGGEALPRSLAERLQPVVPCLLNMYGPTETTVWSSVYTVETAEQNIPIGRPLANTEMYILDQNQQPVPIGISGELYIGGDGLARGYLDRPELTAEKFIKHPFKPGARLYRTGDKARFRTDGAIEFLGRLDHQVKIRGHRIELGEIEFTLRQHPGTRECVVVAREDNDDKRLAAYLVAKPEEGVPTVSELRQFLEERLPRYMVPSTFTFLDALPLTPNGKINRNALPAPDISRTGSAEAIQPPRSPTEETVASIWRDVLGAREVGVFDNFFDLGGHSLLMTQVLARIRGAFQIQLVMRRFFETPTISGLAAAIEEALIEEVDRLSEEEARQLVRRNL